MKLLIAALLVGQPLCPPTLTHNAAPKVRPFAQKYAQCLQERVEQESYAAKVRCSGVRARQLSLARRSLQEQKATEPFDWIDYTVQFIEGCKSRIIVK